MFQSSKQPKKREREEKNSQIGNFDDWPPLCYTKKADENFTGIWGVFKLILHFYVFYVYVYDIEVTKTENWKLQIGIMENMEEPSLVQESNSYDKIA